MKYLKQCLFDTREFKTQKRFISFLEGKKETVFIFCQHATTLADKEIDWK